MRSRGSAGRGVCAPSAAKGKPGGHREGEKSEAALSECSLLHVIKYYSHSIVAGGFEEMS